MLEPLRNPVNWDNFREGAMLVLILGSGLRGAVRYLYFFVLGMIAGLANLKNPEAPAVKREAEEEWGR